MAGVRYGLITDLIVGTYFALAGETIRTIVGVVEMSLVLTLKRSLLL